MALKKLMVKGMHCKSCELLLKEELEEIHGVKKAGPNHKEELVSIDFDGNSETLEKIKNKIKEEGYEL
jgi:copper chaperone CopZ